MSQSALSLPLALLAILSACGGTEPRSSLENPKEQRKTSLAKRMKATCASNATYDRLKQVVFDEAIQIRNADPANLDQLSTHSLARVENPVVKSRDETLDVTICSGRFILQVPPGAERAFAGKRQLVADIEYAAQGAADGSGLVYRIKGSEPIIYSLAAFDLRSQDYRPVEIASRSPEKTVRSSPVPQASIRPTPETTGTRPTAPASRPALQTTEKARVAAPSFSCRAGQSRSEQTVCNSQRLASLDRQMSSQFYSELDRGDQRVRSELRHSRDRFLTYRERCRDESCVEQAYRDRMDEIDDIAARR